MLFRSIFNLNGDRSRFYEVYDFAEPVKPAISGFAARAFVGLSIKVSAPFANSPPGPGSRSRPRSVCSACSAYSVFRGGPPLCCVAALPRCGIQVAILLPKSGDCFEDDLDIEPEAPALAIRDIQTNHLVEGRAILAADLPEAGQTWRRIKSLPMPQGVLFTLVTYARAWANQAHVAAQHVQDLR